MHRKYKPHYLLLSKTSLFFPVPLYVRSCDFHYLLSRWPGCRDDPSTAFFLEILFSHIFCCYILLWPSQRCQGPSSSHCLLHTSGCCSLPMASPAHHRSFPFLHNHAMDSIKFLWPHIWLLWGHQEGFLNQLTPGIHRGVFSLSSSESDCHLTYRD